MSNLCSRAIDAACRNRACALLSVPADAAPEARQRAVLAQLDQADYAPPSAWQDAVDLLFGRECQQENSPRNSKAALREEVECGLNDEIEVFAARFFSVEPGERRRLWSDLCERSRWSPVLARRLTLLEPGLELAGADLEAHGQDRQSELARWILRLFPLRPPGRAPIWIAAREALRDLPAGWELAANELLRSRPRIARLVPELVAEARSLTAQQRQRKRHIAAQKREARQQKWRRWRAALTPSGGHRWIVLVVIISILRVITSSQQHANRSARPTPARPNVSTEFMLDAEESTAWDNFFRSRDIDELDRRLDRIRKSRERAGLPSRTSTRAPSDTVRRLVGGQQLTPEAQKNIERGLEAFRRIRGIKETGASPPQPETTAPGEPGSPEVPPEELKFPELEVVVPAPEGRGRAP